MYYIATARPSGLNWEVGGPSLGSFYEGCCYFLGSATYMEDAIIRGRDEVPWHEPRGAQVFISHAWAEGIFELDDLVPAQSEYSCRTWGGGVSEHLSTTKNMFL